jgi:iron complex outermembrane receptor protein
MRYPSRKAMLLCCAALPALAISTALAQEVEAEDDVDADVIVVRGIKQSIANSLDTKRNATSIVEAVSAEDIGRLPDVNIADSLSRLPGITVQRVQGRAQLLSIRGLGPAYSISLLNGREQVSTNDNRSIEFDAYPSELFTQALVYKTPDAKLAANGVAGTVDLRTARPLDFSERQISLSGRYVQNDNDEFNPEFDNTGYRLFGSYIDQFADDTIGIVLSVTEQSNPTQTLRRQLKPNGTRVEDGLTLPGDNPASGAISREFERTSAAGTLQWQPTDRFEATFDAFYSEYTDGGVNRGIETPLASWDGVGVENLEGSAPGLVDSVTYTDVAPVVKVEDLNRDAELQSYGLNLSYDPTDRINLVLDYSNSSVERQDLVYESFAEPQDGMGNPMRTDAFFRYSADGDYTLELDGGLTDPAAMILTDPRGWGTQAYVKEFDVEDELNQLRLESNFAFDNPLFNQISVGWLFTEREKVKTVDEAFGVLNERQPIPADLRLGTVDLSEIGFSFLAWSPLDLEAAGILSRQPNVNRDILTKNFDVNEEINTFYAQVDIDTMAMGRPLRGNIGARYVNTDQESTGFAINEQDGELIVGEQTLGDEYDDFLPSLNLSWEIQDDFFVRFGAAKTATRPRMDDLSANYSVGRNNLVCQDNDNDGRPDVFVQGGQGYNPELNQFCYSGGGGNPFLQNIEATALDVSFEKYFGEAGAIALAFYNKELEGFIATRTDRVDLSETVEAVAGSDFLAANPLAADGTVSRPVNLAEGTIRGWEATLRLPFEQIHPALEGFGTNLSYGEAISEVPDPNTPGSFIAIQGLSKQTGNADIYYERYGVRARLAANYRSRYLAEVIGFGGNLDYQFAEERTTVDGQVGYTFQRGPVEGLTVLFEGYNLTDEPFLTVQGVELSDGSSTDMTDRHELYGRTFTIAVLKTF